MRFGLIGTIFCLALAGTAMIFMTANSDKMIAGNDKLSMSKEFSPLAPPVDFIVDEFSLSELSGSMVARYLGDFDTLPFIPSQLDQNREEIISLPAPTWKIKPVIRNISAKNTLAAVTIKLNLTNADRDNRRENKQVRNSSSAATLLAQKSRVPSGKDKYIAPFTSNGSKAGTPVKEISVRFDLASAVLGPHPLNIDGDRCPLQDVQNTVIEAALSDEGKLAPEITGDAKEQTIITKDGDFSK